MGRPTGLSPADVDLYYHHKMQDVWEAIHACWTHEEDGEKRYESVCGLAAGAVSQITPEQRYDSVDAALSADASQCALCLNTGAFDTEQ